MESGTLIVFEGPEGAGKTTQVERLAGRLRSAGLGFRQFREPGGTLVGDSIRDLLLAPANTIAPATEALLFLASRAELVRLEIMPSLKRGEIVLLDRFFLSTYAYQVAGRGLPGDAVRAANTLATAGLVPDLTLVLQLPAGEGIARAARRSAQDRMELLGDAFHARVSGAFAEYATPAWQREHPECGPIAAIDASGTAEEVSARIAATVASAFPAVFSGLAEAVAT